MIPIFTISIKITQFKIIFLDIFWMYPWMYPWMYQTIALIISERSILITTNNKGKFCTLTL